MSAPYFAGHIVDQLETYPYLKNEELGARNAGAIVILAGGRKRNAQEYNGETVSTQTMARLRYGAHLQRSTGLPILVSGGIPGEESGLTLAQLMAQVLRDELNAGEVWLEDKSRTTAENAFFSQAALTKKNIGRVYLVTHAWHLPRSVSIFEQAGLEVIPAPTAAGGKVPLKLKTLLPRPSGLMISRQSIREIGGMIWYRIRY